MKLDYHVLWIDDEIDSLSSYKEALMNVNNEVGINTEFVDISAKKMAREVGDVELLERIQDDIAKAFEKGTYELIMIDLHLGDLSGHQLIEFIRDKHTMFRPIVFYSGGNPKGETEAVNQLTKALQQNGLVGKCIFISSRDHLVNDLRNICNEMQIEEQKLTASRGLLMDRTSEIDALVLNYLKQGSTWGGLSGQQATEFFKKAKKRLKDKVRSTKKDLEFFTALVEGDTESLKNCFIDPEKYQDLKKMDSSIRNSFFKALLCVQDEWKDHGEAHNSYFNNNGNEKCISTHRNAYAHQTEAQLQADHTPALCKHFRNDIRKHLQNVQAITKDQ